MAKRPAEESLEELAYQDSPSIKKVRVEFIPNSSNRSNGFSQLSISAPSLLGTNGANGHQMPAPSAQLEDELEDAAQGAGSSDVEDSSVYAAPTRQNVPLEGYTDLYLDTINRAVLDFDFEKLCSVTLSNINVYACLVCGKYFQGRGPKSHAYFHALEVGHHVYVNMQTKKVYVLPEGYEVTSQSLEDIKFVVDPRLSKDEVNRLDREAKDAWDLGGKRYRPGMYPTYHCWNGLLTRSTGFVGMNNIKANDYFNVVIQSLTHIIPLRNFFMLEDLSQKPELVQRFSVLVRKIWNTRAFKSHVSPHELLQQVARQSQKRFDSLHQSDPVDFLSWFLNHLHLALGGSKTRPGTSIIHKVFQGKLKVESQQITAKADAGDRLRFEEAAEVLVDTSRYLMLTLDLPASPLFQDELDKNIIPQV
jgi:U4/U6.U5 tri-snRNP-associated protein 2